MSDATSPTDPDVAARIAALGATVVAQRTDFEAALSTERTRQA